MEAAFREQTSLMPLQSLGNRARRFLRAERLKTVGFPLRRAHRTCLRSKRSQAGERSPASTASCVPFQNGHVRLLEIMNCRQEGAWASPDNQFHHRRSAMNTQVEPELVDSDTLCSHHFQFTTNRGAGGQPIGRRKSKTRPLHPNGFDFAHHERTRHSELQLLSTARKSHFDPERKGRPPARLIGSCDTLASLCFRVRSFEGQIDGPMAQGTGTVSNATRNGCHLPGSRVPHVFFGFGVGDAHHRKPHTNQQPRPTNPTRGCPIVRGFRTVGVFTVSGRVAQPKPLTFGVPHPAVPFLLSASLLGSYFFESSPLKWLSTSSRLSGFLASFNRTE
jgi:hypothetical protein